MKKALSILVALAAVLAGLVLFQHLQGGPPEPEDFLTRALSGDVEFTFRVADGAAFDRAVAPALEALAEELEGEDPLPQLLFLKFRDVLAHLGPSAVRMALSGETFRLEGAHSIKTPAPESLLRGLLLQTAAAHSGLALEAFVLDLDGPVQPLGRLIDEKSGAAIYFALWEGRRGDGLLLTASTPDVLAAMVEAAEDEEGRHLFDDPCWGSAEFVLSLSPEFVEDEMPLAAEALPEGSRLDVALGFDRDDREGLIRFRTNATDLLPGGGGLAPLGEDVAIVGEGPLLALMTARFQGIDLERAGELLDLLAEEEGWASPQEVLRLTAEERGALLDGPIALVLGSRAASPLGETPGLYLLLHPSQPGLAERVLERLVAVHQPIPLGEVRAEGWDRAVTFQAFADVTFAADEGRLLVGLLDPDELSRVPEIEPAFAEIVDGAGYGGFYGSVSRFNEVLGPLLLRLASLDEELARAAEGLQLLAQEVEALTLRVLSPGEALLRVVFRSKGA